MAGSLPNPRHERFCLLIVEGASQSDAYRACGYKTNGRSAAVKGARFMMNAIVRRRVAELQLHAISFTNVTVAQLVAEAANIQQVALRLDNPAAAVAALTAKAKLAGLWVERSESESLAVSYSISDALPSPDEWERERATTIEHKP